MKAFCAVAILLFFLACDRNTCLLEYKFQNKSSGIIKISIPDHTAGFFDEGINTILSDSVISTNFGRTQQNDDVTSAFAVSDSVVVIYNASDSVWHFKDSTKGDYSRSLYNMDIYEERNCHYTYTFTEEDYQKAKARR